jgi:hypothetical protein
MLYRGNIQGKRNETFLGDNARVSAFEVFASLAGMRGCCVHCCQQNLNYPQCDALVQYMVLDFSSEDLDGDDNYCQND